MNAIDVKDYFLFEDNLFFNETDVLEYMDEEFVLQGEYHLKEEGIDDANIYFKLLAQLYVLKNKKHTSNTVLSHLNYLIGYYVGLFLHPFNGEFLALQYINEAVRLESDSLKIDKYREAMAMIREEI